MYQSGLLCLIFILIASFAFSQDNEESGKINHEAKKEKEEDADKKKDDSTKDVEFQAESDKKKSDKTNDVEAQTETDKKKTDKTSKDKAHKPEKLVKAGNLAFPTSQQPTPVISFGQNLLEEEQFQTQYVATDLVGKSNYYIDTSFSLIYAFKDILSIYINAADAIRFKEQHHHSSGPEDLLIQFEYAPYTQEYSTYYDQMTIVGNVTVPTGSAKKKPPTGTGSNSLFFGGTYSRMGVDWFFFTSYGGIFNASSHRSQFGNQFLYQYGVGKRIWSNANWLFDWMVEFDGTYACKNKIQGKIDQNSGGNTVYVTPSLFLSSKKSLVLQAGVGFPIVQQLFGHQFKKDYLFQTKISWTF